MLYPHLSNHFNRFISESKVGIQEIRVRMQNMKQYIDKEMWNITYYVQGLNGGRIQYLQRST